MRRSGWISSLVLRNRSQGGAGGFKRDFSDGDGFYLTSDSKHAVTWATKVKTGAVILFKISEHMLTRFQHLDLRSDQVT